MDKDALVTAIRPVLDSFQAEDKPFNFAALVPVFPGLPSSAYVLLLDGDWMQKISVFESTRMVIERLFKTIPNPEIRSKIDSVDVWLKGRTYPAGIEAEILIDDQSISRYFNSSPSTAFSGSLFAGGLGG